MDALFLLLADLYNMFGHFTDLPNAFMRIMVYVILYLVKKILNLPEQLIIRIY